MRTQEEIKEKIKVLTSEAETFKGFLRDTYGDKQCEHKIERHCWAKRREIEILNWVLNLELPF